jgi:DNA-binding transcriptional LysR family regulator
LLGKIDWDRQIGRRLTLRDLHVFATVAQHGSMAKAALQLGVSQPAVSEVISGLEHALGVRLLDRSAQGVAPTIFGDALLKRSVAVFDELKQSVRDIEFLSDPTVGELRIGYTESLSTTVLPKILSIFSRTYPRVSMLLDDVSAQAAQALGPGLQDRKYDCVLQRIPDELFENELNSEELFEDKLVVVAGANSKWARRRKLDLCDLVDEPWILPPIGGWYRTFVTDAFRERELAVPKAGLVAHSVGLRARLVAEGSYITTFAKSVVHLNSWHNTLKILPIDFSSRALPAGILTLKNRTLSPVVERFIATARTVSKTFIGG